MDHSSTASRSSLARKEGTRFDPLLLPASNVVHRSEVKIPRPQSIWYISREPSNISSSSPLNGPVSASSRGRSCSPIKPVFDSMAPSTTLTVDSTCGSHSMLTTGRSRTVTGPYVPGYSVDATSVVSNANSPMFSIWDLSVTEADVLKHSDQISAFPSKQKSTPVLVTPSASDDVDMDAYPCTTSDDSLLSAASPTPSLQTPATVVSPSNQPTHVRSPSNEKPQISVTVKQVSDPEPEEGHKHSHSH